MILAACGCDGGASSLRGLLQGTDRLCAGLRARGIAHYGHKEMNAVAIRAGSVTPEVARQFCLVPDTHEGEPRWWKIVVLEH